LLFYCSFARDGSGLFLASFMTLLLTVDVGAVSPSAFTIPAGTGCVTGSVSQTFFLESVALKGRPWLFELPNIRHFFDASCLRKSV